MYCEECEESDGYHLIGCGKRLKHLKHEGHLFERTKTMPREKAFIDAWKECNIPKAFLNSGYTTLENILLPESTHNKGPFDAFRSLTGELSERDAFVAASVIQWLGTNCGQGFLHDVKIKLESLIKEPHET